MRRPFVLNFAAFSRHIFEENNKNPSDPKHCTQIIGLLSRLQKRQELISMEYAFLLLPDASILFAFISTVESCECFEEEQPVDWPICTWIGNSVHSIFFTFIVKPSFKILIVDTLYHANMGICISTHLFCALKTLQFVKH